MNTRTAPRAAAFALAFVMTLAVLAGVDRLADTSPEAPALAATTAAARA